MLIEKVIGRRYVSLINKFAAANEFYINVILRRRGWIVLSIQTVIYGAVAAEHSVQTTEESSLVSLGVH